MAKLDLARWPELEPLLSECLSAPEPARSSKIAELRARVEGFQPIEVHARDVSVADAVRSYLFNSQIVTPPGKGRTARRFATRRARLTAAGGFVIGRCTSP